MKILLFLATCLGLYYTSEGLLYSRCDLYRIFKETGLDGYNGISAANWICLAYYKSGYNTDAVINQGSSRNYGMFQINSQWWCNDGKTAGSTNFCRMSCQALLDYYLYDDIECAKTVNDINAWDAWRDRCKGRDLRRFTDGC